MIGLTIKELIPFIGFFSFYTLFFGISFMIIELDIDNTRPGNIDVSDAVTQSEKPA